MEKIKVMLAEDSAPLRRTLADSLRACADLELTGAAGDGETMLTLCRRDPPDVAVLDILMPVLDGIGAAKRLRMELPAVRLLVLTTFDDDVSLRELFALGLDGYLLQTDTPIHIAQPVRTVYHGRGAVDGAGSRRLGELLSRTGSTAEQGPLTETEKKVAQLIAQGMYNKEIAVALEVSYGHARNLVSRVYTRLGAVDREDLAAKLKGLK